ncbi:MAG: MCE family protein [Nocardioidaceae bacterium]
MRCSSRGRRLLQVVALGASALLLGSCSFSIYDLPLPGGADVGSHPYSVTIYFNDVLDLVPQSAVKVDDVTVGKVTDVSLHGWQAKVTVQLNGDVHLADNARAELRQTSLLGEKFVALSQPPKGTAVGTLGNNDVIPLDHTSRNPQVEEVLSALALLLKGGGLAEIKTIDQELNNALGGREPQVRSLLNQLSTFMGQLDNNKSSIVTALRKVNRLALNVTKQKRQIITALDTMPGALRSLNAQRTDLVKMLKGLSRLSTVGTRVIKASKADTVRVLNNLVPVLTQLNAAGNSLTRDMQVFATYPFVDAAVGTTPVVARNMHIGDYTNLSVQADLKLQTVLQGLPGGPGGGGGGGGPLPTTPTGLPTLPTVSLPTASLPTLPGLGGTPGGGTGGGGGSGSPPLCQILGLCRGASSGFLAPVNATDYAPGVRRSLAQLNLPYDPKLVGLFLVGGGGQ